MVSQPLKAERFSNAYLNTANQSASHQEASADLLAATLFLVS